LPIVPVVQPWAVQKFPFEQPLAHGPFGTSQCPAAQRSVLLHPASIKQNGASAQVWSSQRCPTRQQTAPAGPALPNAAPPSPPAA